MSLASRDAQSQRQAVAVNDHMQLARQASAGASYSLVAASGNAGGMLVDAHHRRVDHLHSSILRDDQRLHDAVSDTGSPQANEAIVASSIGAKGSRQIAPRRPGAQNPENTVKDTTVIDPRDTARLVE